MCALSLWQQGLRRPAMPATFRVAAQFAIHEMGKALVATVLRKAREAEGLKPRLERVERVSMVPRGRCGADPGPRLHGARPHACTQAVHLQ